MSVVLDLKWMVRLVLYFLQGEEYKKEKFYTMIIMQVDSMNILLKILFENYIK
jgi:hypothetical protein